MLDPQKVAQRWAQGMQGAAQKATEGVNAVTESPGAKAAAAADFWQQQVTSPEAKAKFQRRSAALSLGDWKAAILTKGIPRMASGAQAALPKFGKFLAAFLPHVESVAQQVRQMPKGGVEAGIARAAAQIRGNAQFQYQG